MPSQFDSIYKGRVVPALMRLSGTTDTIAIWHAPDERDYTLRRVIAGIVRTELREDENGNVKKYDIRVFTVDRFPDAFSETNHWTARQREGTRGYIDYRDERWAVEEIEALSESLVRFRTVKIVYHERARPQFRTAV